MKIAVTSKGKDIDSEVGPGVGSAPYILIVDTFSFGIDVMGGLKNVNESKGTEIQAAAQIGDKGVHVLLTGFGEPCDFSALNAAGIKVANDQNGTVREAVNSFNEGRISFCE